MIDYRQVLDIIDRAPDPAAALESFVAQEREHAAFSVQKRVMDETTEHFASVPVWGPNDSGEMMVDMSREDFQDIMNRIMRAADGTPHPTPSRRPRHDR